MRAAARFFGTYPQMNIRHEKNLENMYFDAVNNPARLPGTVRSPCFRSLHTLRRRWMRTSAAAPCSFPCVGDETGSEDFRGDVCP